MITDLEKIPMITELKDELQKYVGKNIHRCPFCLTDIDEKELLEVNVYDLFEDMFLAYKDRNQLFKEKK